MKYEETHDLTHETAQECEEGTGERGGADCLGVK